MTDKIVSILEILPVEVFHNILNHFDTSQMFYSLYNVSPQINAFLISYNHYKLNLCSISRFNFDVVCNIIQPQHIISLILSDDDQTPGQIGLFLSLFNVQELRRLHSLTLLQIEERHLFIFLQHIPIHNLRSLTIKWRGGSHYRGNAIQTLSLLSSAISQSNLRYLDLNLWIYGIKNLLLSNPCTLQYLCIDVGSFSEYRLLLNQLPHLKRLILRDYSMYDVDTTFSAPLFIRPAYKQLRSLSLNNKENIKMKTLKSFLSVTPSLVHLKLIGNGCISDGVFDELQWKRFIRKYLCLLNKFEFYFTTHRNISQTADDISSLIDPFSNKFWIEKKHWFVKCDFIKSFSQIKLYSIPICQPHFEYIAESNIISRSTLTNDVDRTNGVHMMTVNISSTIIEREECMNIFHQVTELNLQMDNQCLIDPFQFLSTILNLSHLVKISLNIYFTTSTINTIVNLLQKTPNLHTLHNYHRTINSQIICSIVPRHVKYLNVRIDRIKDMKTILERLDHLSSVTFQFLVGSLNYPTNIIKWLKQRRTFFTFWCNSDSIHLWFDNS